MSWSASNGVNDILRSRWQELRTERYSGEPAALIERKAAQR